MKNFLRVALFAVVASVFAFALPASAQTEVDVWSNYTIAGYCGTSSAHIENVGTNASNTQYVNGSILATDCGENQLDIPANWLQVAVSLRCKQYAGQTEWEGWNSGWVSNPNHSSFAQTTSGPINKCGTGTGFGYPHARMVVSAKYYIYGSGWTGIYARTTHECSLVAGNPCTF